MEQGTSERQEAAEAAAKSFGEWRDDRKALGSQVLDKREELLKAMKQQQQQQQEQAVQ